MMCAKCQASIPWYRVAWISQWTFVRCSACGQRWGRKLDLQAWLLLALMLVGILALRQLEMPMLVRAALLVSWIVIGVYVDSATIKLVPAKKAAATSRNGHTRTAVAPTRGEARGSAAKRAATARAHKSTQGTRRSAERRHIHSICGARSTKTVQRSV